MVKDFVSLGLFIIDHFDFGPERSPIKPQIGGGGTYALIGARIWLPPESIGMIIDRGTDFDEPLQSRLESFGKSMWHFRDCPERFTTSARITYRSETRFEYLGERTQLSPRDMENSPLSGAKHIHFICSPDRAAKILAEVSAAEGWDPVTIYEPLPVTCIPEELNNLRKVLKHIHIFSPNAEEALSLLSIALPVTRDKVEAAAKSFTQECRTVVIRSGPMGAFVTTRDGGGRWIAAYWSESSQIVDVTGAGNGFLGGLSAGLHLTAGDVYKAASYASVSASFMIEQYGLPQLTTNFAGDAQGDKELWNGDDPRRRLRELLARPPSVREE